MCVRMCMFRDYMYVFLSIYLSVCLCFCLIVCLFCCVSVYLYSTYMGELSFKDMLYRWELFVKIRCAVFVCLIFCLFIHLFVHLLGCVCLFIFLSVCVFVCLSVYSIANEWVLFQGFFTQMMRTFGKQINVHLFVCPSLCFSVCLSVYVCVRLFICLSVLNHKWASSLSRMCHEMMGWED